MKKVLIIFVAALFTVATYAQERTDIEVPAQTSDKTELTQEEMLINLQKQMSVIQKQLDDIQYSISDKAKSNKDIIPVKPNKHKTKFYWSARASFLLSSSQYSDIDSTAFSPQVKASYALKPAFGYIFNDRLTVGTTLVFADCRFSDVSMNSLTYIIANAFIGGGFSLSDYITWSVQPYVRYRFCHVIWEKLNLWGEFSCYAGQKIPRDPKTHQIQTMNTSTIYGVKLRPMLTLDLNKDLMLFTTMEFVSWDGSCRQNNGTTLVNNHFTLNIIPVYSLLSGIFNIGIIKRF